MDGSTVPCTVFIVKHCVSRSPTQAFARDLRGLCALQHLPKALEIFPLEFEVVPHPNTILIYERVSTTDPPPSLASGFATGNNS